MDAVHVMYTLSTIIGFSIDYLHVTCSQVRAKFDVLLYCRQPKFHGGHDYAVEYQEKEEEALISRSAFVSSDFIWPFLTRHMGVIPNTKMAFIFSISCFNFVLIFQFL